MIRILFLAFIMLTFNVPVQAADKMAADTKETSAVQSQPKPRTEAEEKKLDEKRKRIETKKTELNGSSWELTLTPSDAKAKPEKDTFTFQNGQFNSKDLVKRGFASTNYTVSVPDDATELAVWETMQTGKDGVIFIRGEWEKDKMSGNITEQLEEGKKVLEYSFSTNSRVAIPPTSDEDKKEEKQAPAAAKSGSEEHSLVSKEKTARQEKAPDNSKNEVAPFAPGTTDEASNPGKK